MRVSKCKFRHLYPIDMSEPDDCIAELDAWIKVMKDDIYNNNIKGPSNDQGVLTNYINDLEVFANRLNREIKAENSGELNTMKWPESLMECIKDMNKRIVILDRIEHWCIRYPFVRSKLHLEELARENAGVN